IQPQPGGRLTITGANLRLLIRFAYNVDEAQISGGPAWMDSDRFDIAAKGEGNPTVDQLREMLQKLLADRFNLKLHRESKDLPVNALLPAKGGAKLKEVQDDAAVSGPTSRVIRGPGDTAAGPRRGVAMMIGGTTQIAGTMSMTQLSQTLATFVGRKVI